ncbi:hypothetical protein ACLOJK_025611 [Asimina triloba]
MDQRQGNTDRFLLRPIRPSIFTAARCLQPRLHRLPLTARDRHHAADAHLQPPAVRPHPPARLHRRLPVVPSVRHRPAAFADDASARLCPCRLNLLLPATPLDRHRPFHS